MIIPRPKKEKIRAGRVPLGDKITVSGDEAGFVAEFISEFYPAVEGKGKIAFVRDENLKSEAYTISAGDDVIVRFSDRLGARNAAATLVQLIGKDESGYYMPFCDVKDAPDCGFRSVLIDLARGIPDINRLKEDIRRLALFKCNYVHLHLMDAQGTCYNSSVVPFTGQINGTNRCDKAYLAELAAFCEKLGIEVIPEIEIPSHASGLWHLDPKIRCVTDLPDPSPACICAGSERTYEIFARLIDEVCEIFKGRYFHVGGDEIMFEDFPDWNYHCHYAVCKTCRERAEKEGFEPTVQNLYYYVMRRMHDMLAAKGKTMIVWNDEIDVSRPVPLPKDIIVQYWTISAPGRGPWEGCSYEKLVSSGFRVINSSVKYEYIDRAEYFNPERASGFVWNKNPDPVVGAKNVIGAETCAWEYGNPKNTHYLTSFTFATALMLDREWNTELAAYGDEFRRSLTRAMLGSETPENYDVTELFGSVVPPRDNDKITFASIGNEIFRKGQIAPIRAKLDEIGYTYSPILLARIKELFNEER